MTEKHPDLLPVVRLSAQQVQTGHRFDAWRESTSPLFDVVPLEDSTSFEAGATLYLLDDLVVSRVHFGAQRFLRSRSQLANGDTDYVTLQLYRRGSIGGQVGDVPLLMAPDRVAMHDFALSYAGTAAASEFPGVTIPRILIASMDRIRQHSTMFSFALSSSKGQCLVDAMQELWRKLPNISRQEAPAIVARFVELVNRLLESGPDPQVDVSERAVASETLFHSRKPWYLP